MDTDALIEWVLERSVGECEGADAPPKLASAIRYAVFPGGARVRPQLCLAVAHACGENDEPAAIQAAAGAGAAIELLHCASLVHDDLPCFDGADLRRGKPSVHCAYGEPLAVLVGDALIVSAFRTVVRECEPQLFASLPALMDILNTAVGAPSGIVAGQAWESEEVIDLSAYHRAKTGAMFVAATMAGAAAQGQDPLPWRGIGDRLGEAYQVADDIRDTVLSARELGKPKDQDAINDRPNAVQRHGLQGALNRLDGLITEAADSVPDCRGADMLRGLIAAQANRLMPQSLLEKVA
jgi:geranylgeranyl diphosphate synthase, type II